MGDEHPPVEQFCVDYDKIEPAGLHSILDFGLLSLDSINHDVFFRCEYDKCNNETLTVQAISIFMELSYIPMILFLNYDEPESEEEEITASPIKSSTSQQTTKPNVNNTTTTIKTNNGMSIQNTNTINYMTFLAFISHLILLA